MAQWRAAPVVFVAFATACAEPHARTGVPVQGMVPRESSPESSEPPPDAPESARAPSASLFINAKGGDFDFVLGAGCTSRAFAAARAPAVAFATWGDADSWCFCATSSAEGEPTLYLVSAPNGGGQAQFFPDDQLAFQSTEASDVSVTLSPAPVGEIVSGQYTAALTNAELGSSFVLSGSFRVRRLPDDQTLDARLAP